MRKNLLMLFAGSLVMMVAATQAQAKLDGGLIDVSFGNKENVPSGKAVLGADADKWNAMDGANGDKVALTNAKGDATDVKVTFASEATWDSDEAGFIGTPFEKLLRHYLYTKDAKKVTLSGLTPNAAYDLIVYSASNAEDRKTKFTVGKDSKTTTYAKDKKELADGVNYAKFTATADADGSVTITYEGAGDDGEGNFNGLQISPQAK